MPLGRVSTSFNNQNNKFILILIATGEEQGGKFSKFELKFANIQAVATLRCLKRAKTSWKGEKNLIFSQTNEPLKTD